MKPKIKSQKEAEETYQRLKQSPYYLPPEKALQSREFWESKPHLIYEEHDTYVVGGYSLETPLGKMVYIQC